MYAKDGEKRVRFWLTVAIIIVVAVFALVFFTFPDNSQARFFFSEPDENGCVSVRGYNGDKKTLTLPETDAEGHPVTAIEAEAFGGHYSNLEKVIIPDSVTVIGEDAFANSPKLKTVVLSSNLESIGRGAFSGCVRLEKITLPDTLRVIDDQAFYGCLRLGRLYIPASVERIGYDAFAACESLLLDVSDSPVAAAVAEDYSIETGKFDRTSLYVAVIFAVTAILLAGAVFLWRRLRKRRTLKRKEVDECEN